MEPERNFKKLGTLAKVNYEYKTDTFRNFFAASYNTTVHTANVQCIDNGMIYSYFNGYSH